MSTDAQSLRPRPGETAEQVLERVTRAAQKSLYPLSEHDSTVDIQRPKRLEVRETANDSKVCEVEIDFRGDITVRVAPGVTIETIS